MTPRLILTDRSTCGQAPPHLIYLRSTPNKSFALSSREGLKASSLSTSSFPRISLNCSTSGPSLDSATEREISGLVRVERHH
ncbi:hypothetical protein QQF64_027230 [Cirrhinus molitorella]|uniref:Uncharacterized protein n=1 Tax=Cirrhinus molitorella TaxID=172907 RepID=A0ABR3NCG8_9TELE